MLGSLMHLDSIKVSGSQTFRPRGEGSSIPSPLVGGSSDPSDIATRTSCHGHMSKWIDSNPNGWSGVTTTKSKKKLGVIKVKRMHV